jgi:hypothetical protein
MRVAILSYGTIASAFNDVLGRLFSHVFRRIHFAFYNPPTVDLLPINSAIHKLEFSSPRLLEL